MTEWWTYRPSDFLMFAPRTYQRLFELYNAWLWPAQSVALAAALGLLWLAARRGAEPGSSRLAFALLALAWGWVGAVFELRFFATINWAAAWIAAAFGLQALLWLALALHDSGLRWRRGGGARRGVGLALLVMALAWPLLAPATGRPWSQAELFGLAPDPTLSATLGVLLLHEGSAQYGAARRALVTAACWALPLLGTLFALLLQWTMLTA